MVKSALGLNVLEHFVMDLMQLTLTVPFWIFRGQASTNYVGYLSSRERSWSCAKRISHNQILSSKKSKAVVNSPFTWISSVEKQLPLEDAYSLLSQANIRQVIDNCLSEGRKSNQFHEECKWASYSMFTTCIFSHDEPYDLVIQILESYQQPQLGPDRFGHQRSESD